MATAELRQMFEEQLKAEKKKGTKGRKKAVKERESEIVGDLEKSLTKDDPLLESNTYNGEAEKNLKNLRNSGGVKGKENTDSELPLQQKYLCGIIRRRKKFSYPEVPHDKACAPSTGNIVRKGKLQKKEVDRLDSAPLDALGCSQTDTANRQVPGVLKSLYQNDDVKELPADRTLPGSKSVTFNLLKKFEDVDANVDNDGINIRKSESEHRGERSRFEVGSLCEGLDERARGKKRRRKKLDVESSRQSSALSSTFLNKPIRVSVENVNLLTNALSTIWEQHSETLIEEKTKSKRSGALHRDRPTSSFKRHKKRGVLSNSSTIAKPDSDFSALMKQLEKVSGTNAKAQESSAMSFVLEDTASESAVFETIWRRLSHEFFDVTRCSSEPRIPYQDGLSRMTGKEIMLADSFESVERILLQELEKESLSSLEELVNLSRPEHRNRFWRDFWRRNGVEIVFDGLSEDTYPGRYIEDVGKVAPKKRSGTKKKKAKIKEQEETQDDGAPLYATVKKTTKKSRTPKKSDRAALDDPKEQQTTEEAQRPVPIPRKLPDTIPRKLPDTIPKTVENTGTENDTIPGQEEATSTGNAEETIPKTVARRKKRKKRDTARESPSTVETPQEQTVEETVTEPLDAGPHDAPIDATLTPEHPSIVEDDGTILGITVHHCDHIRVDPKYLAHPVVKVSISDGFSGKFLSKCDSSRHVSSFYESDAVSTIVPMMTQPFDFKQNRSLLPRWEELLIFNEPYVRLTHRFTAPGAPNPIVFFVIRDFVTMAKANNMKGRDEQGWHNVAWAFLKLVSSNGKPNAGRKMRLQLFYPPRAKATLLDSNTDPAHDWWLNHPRQRYPGTLFVTVKAIIPPLDLKSSVRSLSALQREESAMTFNEMNESLERTASEARLPADEDDLSAMQQWSRLPGQTCKIPNVPFLRFWAGSDGAFVLQFSHRGTKLAAACRHEATYPILLHGIPAGEEIGIITGHQQLVYDLQWSKNDKYLLSASADGTAQVWDLEHTDKPRHTLPHPSYVYTAVFHPTAQHLIVTGSYDSIIRVWNIASASSQLTQELDGHKAIINSIIFDNTGLNMFSADGGGVIISWNCSAHPKAKKNVKTDWTMKAKIEDRDLAGVCINSLRLHPHNNKILIHCRDSTVRLLDSRIHSMKKFVGLLNYRQLLRSAVTPCGSFIFSGSEDGFVYVWNAESGDQVAVYNELGYTSPVHTVAYHPHDHIVAFCSFAQNQSILLYKFNSTVATMEAGFSGQDFADHTLQETVPSINAHIEAAKTAVNLDRIKHQLDSVLADTLDTSGGSFLPPIPRGLDTNAVATRKSSRSASPHAKIDALHGGLLSTLDETRPQLETAVAPSYLSPHARPEMRAMAQQYIKAGRQDAHGIPRRGVSPVGGSPYRSQGAGIPPDVSFTEDKDGKRRLSISSAAGSISQAVVVAVFDYQANRSDELTVVRGDMIRVLYKDSANWWFGEKAQDGKQGYFPSNYVEQVSAAGELKQKQSPAPVFGVPDSTPEKKVYALKMPGGQLNFYSQSESEGDEDRLNQSWISARQRRREMKLRETIERARHTPSPLTATEESVKPSETTYPKSILQKGSPRSKPTAHGPSSESGNIKEVSFADDKAEDDDAKGSKKKLIDSIQAAMQKIDSAPAKPDPIPSPSAVPRRAKPKPRASPRSASARKPPPTHDETSFAEPPRPKSASSFGILKSVQALMSQKESESAFSQSVLGGHGVAATPRSGDNPAFTPAVHSTAVKKLRSPVENDDPATASAGSVVRRARPLPKVGRTLDREEIPLVKMGKSKSGRGSPAGQSNPAYDTSP